MTNFDWVDGYEWEDTNNWTQQDFERIVGSVPLKTIDWFYVTALAVSGKGGNCQYDITFDGTGWYTSALCGKVGDRTIVRFGRKETLAGAVYSCELHAQRQVSE